MKTKLKTPSLFKSSRNKLRASTAQRRLRIGATADYEELAEPNMKLSRALLIVLLLHVVAVAGIIAFNAIKTRQSAYVNIPDPLAIPPNAAIQSGQGNTRPVPAASQEAGDHKIVNEEHQSEHTRRAENAKGPVNSGKTYVVAKGDNPVTIAKKFKVLYEDLIAINHIDDPRKLQIGQKLLIPARPPRSRKGDE